MNQTLSNDTTTRQHQAYTHIFNSDKPCFIYRKTGKTVITDDPTVVSAVPPGSLFISHPVAATALGSAKFREEYGIRYACMAGAMAGGIAGEPHVTALGSAGILSTFGAGGVPLARVEEAIASIKNTLGGKSFAVNLIHNTFDKQLEIKTVELLLRRRVTIIEASAFMRMTPAIVYYRAKGLSQRPDGSIACGNRVIAKLSRQSVARQFMSSAPDSIVNTLLAGNLITGTEAEMLGKVPMADDITVEADSGGHTDNLPLVNILPEMVQFRDILHKKHRWKQHIRIGAAGGISTPAAAQAAFMMGADYLVTGSINQSCVEASTSPEVKLALARADVPDVTMAPAADMFELGVKVQVLKKGVFYPVRANQLYSWYKRYNSLEELSSAEREKIEKELFQRSIEEVWNDTSAFFRQTAPNLLEKALADPKMKMALVFRWYLGLSTRWAKSGEIGRESDYQIWCGPSMGAFNNWVKGTEFEDPKNRHVVAVTEKLMTETAYLRRLGAIRAAGFSV
jgi:trans-AT polyketide synthase, acyltransferase and oxidoreductase domains